MQSPICEGLSRLEYQVLTEFLEPLKAFPVEDYVFLEEDDLISVLSKNHSHLKPLMRAFYRKFILSNANVHRHSERYQLVSLNNPLQRTFSSLEVSLSVSEDGVLDLRKKVVNNRFKSTAPHLISTDELRKRLKKEDFCSKVIHLKMSGCSLGDSDMFYIHEVVKILPHCQVIDVSSNHFHGFYPEQRDIVDSNLMALLNMQQIRFVSILESPLACPVDRKDFFHKLDHSHFKKLIFIPFHLLTQREWISNMGLSDDKNLLDLVINTHHEYFNEQN